MRTYSNVIRRPFSSGQRFSAAKSSASGYFRVDRHETRAGLVVPAQSETARFGASPRSERVDARHDPGRRDRDPRGPLALEEVERAESRAG